MKFSLIATMFVGALGILATPTEALATFKVTAGDTWLIGRTCGDLSREEAAALDLINKYRREKHLSALYCDSVIADAARAYSVDMCENGAKNHLSSDGKSFIERMKATGLVSGAFNGAENIYPGPRTAKEAFAGWKNSKGHNENMLAPWATRMGISRVNCKKGGSLGYWTLILWNGKPMSNTAIIPEGFVPYDGFVSEVSIPLYTDKPRYAPGETVRVLADFENPGPAFRARLQGFLLPGGSPAHKIFLGELPSIPVAAGAQVTAFELYRNQVPGWLPAGNALVALLYDADSGQLLSWSAAFLAVNAEPSAVQIEEMQFRVAEFVKPYTR